MPIDKTVEKYRIGEIVYIIKRNTITNLYHIWWCCDDEGGDIEGDFETLADARFRIFRKYQTYDVNEKSCRRCAYAVDR